jgi:hypothetical protein
MKACISDGTSGKSVLQAFIAKGVLPHSAFVLALGLDTFDLTCIISGNTLVRVRNRKMCDIARSIAFCVRLHISFVVQINQTAPPTDLNSCSCKSRNSRPLVALNSYTRCFEG